MEVKVYNYHYMQTTPPEQKSTIVSTSPQEQMVAWGSCCGAAFNLDKILHYPQGVTFELFTSEELKKEFLDKSPKTHEGDLREFFKIKTSFGDLHLLTQTCKEQLK